MRGKGTGGVARKNPSVLTDSISIDVLALMEETRRAFAPMKPEASVELMRNARSLTVEWRMMTLFLTM